MKDCCNHSPSDKKCIRKSDKKVFSLPRKFSKKRCKKGIKGFTMRSSCAPYKDCFKNKKKTKITKKRMKRRKRKKTKKRGGSRKTKKTKKKKQFLYNPDDPKKSFDVYIDKDPSDTIPIKYTTIDDVKKTIRKLERLYKNGKYPHKRIWQVGMILRVRLKVLKDKKPKEYILAERYFQHLGKRTKIKDEKDRKRFHFKI
tara:strand:+ start:134 stop:730 length:597 start_codon:yes stop_codon:yes gene_type:complete